MVVKLVKRDSKGSEKPNSVTWMSGTFGNSSVVMAFRNLRSPTGVLWSQLAPGSDAGPAGNPSDASADDPAHSGYPGYDELLVHSEMSIGRADA